MPRFLKPGKVVILLTGRYAGRKAVIVKNVDDGTGSRPYGHCLVCGVDRCVGRGRCSKWRERVCVMEREVLGESVKNMKGERVCVRNRGENSVVVVFFAGYEDVHTCMCVCLCVCVDENVKSVRKRERKKCKASGGGNYHGAKSESECMEERH